MRILVLSEHLDPHPWASSRWAEDLARGLVGRGHRVVLACDSVFDVEALRPLEVVVHRERRRERDRRPLAFVRWAARVRREAAHEVSVSLSRLAPAHVRVEVGPTSVRAWAAEVAGRNPISAAFEAVQHPHLPIAAVLEARAAASRVVRRTVRLGGRPGGADLGYASRLEEPEPAALAGLRARTREALAIGPERPAILISAVHPERSGLEPMLRAFEALRQAWGAQAPVLVVAGRSGYAVHAAAARLGGLEGVRFLGATGRIDAALAACDLAAAPLAGRDAGDTGRFIADALRYGRPVIADRAARGAELLAPVLVPGEPPARPGHVMARPDVSHWRRALHGALSARWQAEASRAARMVGRGLSMGALVERLERVLVEVVASEGARSS